MRQQCAALLALTLLAPSIASAQSMESAQALRRWVTAVNEHRPGSPDESARFAASLTYSDRLRLDPAMQLFVDALRRAGGLAGNGARHQIMDLYRGVRQDPGVALFIRRAAMLHTDAAIFADRFPVPADDAPAPTPMARAPWVKPPSPLLSKDEVLMHLDGRVVGETLANWNWPFARSLLDLLLPTSKTAIPTAADGAFVVAWYHAVDAYLMATGNLAEVIPQLAHAAVSLPDDPRVTFDRACLAEAQGLAYNQVLRGDAGYRARTSVEMPAEDRTNGDAEGLFRRAIGMDAGYAEARVRLARLLTARGQQEEAAAEIERALANGPDRFVAFYAHLVGGRIAHARDRGAESLDHYVAASTIFPDAQSALLGASQAALMTADVGAALSFVERLGPRSEEFAADPWRYYRHGPGRDATALINALWARMSTSAAADRGGAR